MTFKAPILFKCLIENKTFPQLSTQCPRASTHDTNRFVIPWPAYVDVNAGNCLTAEFKSPAEVIDFDVLAEAFCQEAAAQEPDSAVALSGASANPGVVHIPSPMFDYIPPHLISLFVTDTGGYTPSYVYRLLTEYYSRWVPLPPLL